MKRKIVPQLPQGSTLFLKFVIWSIGLFVLWLCVFILPVGILTDEVGYYRPILIGLYIPAIPLFFALYQALTLLGYIDNNRVFSPAATSALKNIKYAAAIISALFALGMPYIYYAADRDDAPGVIVIGLVITFASLVIASAAGLFQQLLQKAIAIKSENDLTV